MRKAFVGPIGDDLPSVIIIILSLMMFFTAITYSFNAYNEKLGSLRLLRAGLETGRMLASKGVLPSINAYDSAVQDIAATYGVSISIGDDESACTDFPYRMKYLVAVMGSSSVNSVELKTAWVCVKG